MAKRKRKPILLWLIQLSLTILPLVAILLISLFRVQSVWLSALDHLPSIITQYVAEETGADLGIGTFRITWTGLQATGVTLDYNQIPIARAPALEVMFPLWGQRTLDIRATNPEIWLHRDRRGVWNVEKFFQETDTEAGLQIPINIQVRRGTVHLRDTMVAKGRAPVQAEVLDIEGSALIRERWLKADLQFTHEQTGETRLELFRDEQQTALNGSASRLSWQLAKHYIPKIPVNPYNAFATQVKFQTLSAEGQEALYYSGEGNLEVESFRVDRRPAPWRNITGSFQFSNAGVTTDLRAQGEDNAQVKLALQPAQNDWQFALELEARGANAARLWRTFAENNPVIRGGYAVKGRGYGSFSEPVFEGEARVDSAQTQEYRAERLSSSFLLTREGVWLPNLQARVENAPINAKVEYRFNQARAPLKAYVSAHRLRLEQIASLRRSGFQGTVSGRALLSGTPEALEATLNLTGEDLRYKNRAVGSLRARAIYRDDLLRVESAALTGHAGFVKAFGEYRGGKLDFQVSGTEIDLERLQTYLDAFQSEGNGSQRATRKQKTDFELDGIGYARGSLTGSLENPVFEGSVEVYGGRVGSFGAEVATAKVAASTKRVQLSDIQILRRSARIFGNGSINLQPQSPTIDFALTAQEVNAEDLNTYLGDKIQVSGLINGSLRLTGSVEIPRVFAEIQSERLVVDQLPFQSLSATLRYQNARGLEIEQANARLEDGIIELNGSYQADELKVLFQANELPLRAFAAYLPEEVSLRGLVNLQGEFNGSIEKPNGFVTVSTQPITLNRAPVGNIEGRIEVVDGLWRSQRLTVKEERDLLELTDVLYDPDNDALWFNGKAEQLPVSWVRRLALAVINTEQADPALIAKLQSIQGTLSGDWSMSGSTKQPEVTATIRAQNLLWDDQSLGEAFLNGAWSRETLTIERLRWEREEARLLVSGIAEMEGSIQANIQMEKFPLTLLQVWDPNLTGIEGTVNLNAQATGRTQSPNITASVQAQDLVTRGQPVEAVSVGSLRIQEGSIQIKDSSVTIDGYIGQVSGKLPFRWDPFEIPKDEPVDLAVRLQDGTPLSVLSLYAPIDADRTSGFISARIDLSGTLDQLEPTGFVEIKGGTLGFSGARTLLENLRLEARFDKGIATIAEASALSSAGGSLRIDPVTMDLQDIESLRLNTSLTLSDFRIEELNPMGVPLIARGSLNGTLKAVGPWRNPLIEGRVEVSNGTLRLPAEWGGEQTPREYEFNPRFLITVDVKPNFELSNAGLQAYLEGSMGVSGSLQEPAMNGTFILSRGSLSLPTTRLRLEPDSSILMSYPFTNLEGESTMRLDLNLRATTSVVYTDFTGDPIRYRIELNIRGPLDDPNRFQMTAQSDPPGLSERRILTLLGRGAVIEDLASGRDPSQILREQLLDVATGQVLPALFENIETGLSAAFGLEQLVLDYNPRAPFSVYIVKNLFDGVGIAYRRSFATQTQQWQARLFYRLPVQNRLLQRIKVGVGIDERQQVFYFIEASALFR